MIQVPNLKYKTTLCHSYTQGTTCDKGQACYFAHGIADLRTLEQNRQIISARNKANFENQHPQNYKTIFCKFYSRGQCKLGNQCTFAHERREKKTKLHQQETAEIQNYVQLYNFYSQMYPWYNSYSMNYSEIEGEAQFPPIDENQRNESMKSSVETVEGEPELTDRRLSFQGLEGIEQQNEYLIISSPQRKS